MEVDDDGDLAKFLLRGSTERISMSMSGVSMESFGPVSLDYFNQRRVVDVRMGTDKDGPVWTIEFEGGGLVHNYDDTIPMPQAIKGAALTLTILGGTYSGGDKDGNPVTEMRFGLESVKLNPTEYAIVHPTYTKGQVVFAQRSNANMVVTPPHPDERVADGPSQEWIDQQAADDGA